jgi:hypothetical protein
MIKFTMAAGLAGAYDTENGFVMTEGGELAGELAIDLQSELDRLLKSSPHAVLGAYALAIHILKRYKADIDTRRLPKFDPNVRY